MKLIALLLSHVAIDLCSTNRCLVTTFRRIIITWEVLIKEQADILSYT
jgi:hypothetical protein